MWNRPEGADILFCPSVPYTGTTFLLEFLRNNPSIKDFASMSWIIRSDREFKEGTTLVHAHLTNNLIPLIIEYARSWPIVVPLRDPLLAILSNNNRNYYNTSLSIVDCFIKLVVVLKSHNPIYVPIDLLDELPAWKRGSELIRIFYPLGFISPSHCTKLAVEWPRMNAQESYLLRQYYYDDDGAAIKGIIPKEWDKLIAARSFLQPFLENRGYKNLLWWET